MGPNLSPASGFITVTVIADMLTVDLSFSGLTGGVAAAGHIHCCVPVGTNIGVAVGFTGLPAATSGTYVHTFDLLDPTIYTAAFLGSGGGTAAGAEAALIAGLDAHQAYSNLHNATLPGGEIRGNLAAAPEPSLALLLAAGTLGGIGLAARKDRRTL